MTTEYDESRMYADIIDFDQLMMCGSGVWVSIEGQVKKVKPMKNTYFLKLIPFLNYICIINFSLYLTIILDRSTCTKEIYQYRIEEQKWPICKSNIVERSNGLFR